MHHHSIKFAIASIVPLLLLFGLHLSLAIVIAAQPKGVQIHEPVIWPNVPPTEIPEAFPVITDTTSQNWAHISGDCVAFRDGDGGVFLHNMSTDETITITDTTQAIRKVVISEGMVVWRSDLPGSEGLWGYYHPDCSDAGLFGTSVISPFYILKRGNSHAPAISGEMVTFDTWAPAGQWHIAMVELDANNNNIPDAVEAGYDPMDDNIIIRLSCCAGGPYVTFWQQLSDVYWSDNYKVACWYGLGWVKSNGEVFKRSLTCNNLTHYQDTPAYDHAFIVNDDTEITAADYKGIITIHEDLVVWTGTQDGDSSYYDLYIADLDPDDDYLIFADDLDWDNDGTENQDDSDPGEAVSKYLLVNQVGNQQHPDIDWPYVVWTDGRHCQQEIYAYDLSVDSNNDGVPDWRDPDNSVTALAEIRVTNEQAHQFMPEVSGGTSVWIDNRLLNSDIFGNDLTSIPSQQLIGKTALEKARNWLGKQIVSFTDVQSLPGYQAGTVTRYKSFTRTGESVVRLAQYEPLTGTYLVSFDFCTYGTPEQKTFLGRFGRGFTYDQGLTLIALTMLEEPSQAHSLGHYVSSFQNSGQLTETLPGSFGFSFNGQGFGGERDSFYDMDYLRGGANGWIGYGYLYYSRAYSDMQFMPVMTGVADYLLSLQAVTPTTPLTDARYGLFKGGSGWWEDGDVFQDGARDWVSAEHNIDMYFYLRDLGLFTDDERYIDAANLQKANMLKLWNEDLGRLDQGLTGTGQPDTTDALDASSWGAMYWIATGELTRAISSLTYADQVYSNTVTVSNTVTISPEITLWGYKPYSGTTDPGSAFEFNWTGVDVVWSEGSLGMAMAYLKLGHALLNHCSDELGNAYIQKAEAIVSEMEKLQTLDPDGGLFYAVYPDYPKGPGGVITDFARAPSAAGTTWLIMVQQAMADQTWRDAFWGPDANLDWQCPPQSLPIYKIYLPAIFKS